NLETAGKLSPEESYQKIRALWKQLKRSRQQLGIGSKLFSDDNEQSES
nr:hypothetical protein [Tatlockia sp.]